MKQNGIINIIDTKSVISDRTFDVMNNR